jgi:hypothetical protein
VNGGDAFKLVGVADRHLWIVISDPSIDPNRVLFVNLTTHDPHEDQTVILDVGDHPFIAHRTCVAYSRARTATDQQLEQLKAVGRLQSHDPVSPALLQRLRDGAAASDRIKTEHVEVLWEQGLVGP